MFGNNENKMEHLVKNHQWEKIRKKLHGADSKTRLALAAACGALTDEEAINLLISLIGDADESVQMQVVKSLGETGSDFAKSHLMQLFNRLPAEKNALRDEIQKSIKKIGEGR